jgi:hypothetical protein
MNDVTLWVSNLSLKFLLGKKPQPLPADRERFEQDYQKCLIKVGRRRRS